MPWGSLCPRAALKKSEKILKIFEMPKYPGDSYVTVWPKKIRKDIYKYLRCVNAPGIPYVPMQP